MSINYKIEDKVNYIYFFCEGIYVQKEILDIFDKALDSAKSRKLNAVLLDARKIKGDPPTTMNRYEIGSKIAEMQNKSYRGIQLAIVGNEPMIDQERFGETVALNKGALGKVFTEIDEAVAWIEEKASSK